MQTCITSRAERAVLLALTFQALVPFVRLPTRRAIHQSQVQVTLAVATRAMPTAELAPGGDNWKQRAVRFVFSAMK
jgi:hypothetical protein